MQIFLFLQGTFFSKKLLCLRVPNSASHPVVPSPVYSISFPVQFEIVYGSQLYYCYTIPPEEENFFFLLQDGHFNFWYGRLAWLLICTPNTA